MKLVSPNVELWTESDWKEHVAKCARVCYASSGDNDEALVKSLIDRQHYSVFRHSTQYFIVSYSSFTGKMLKQYNEYVKLFGAVPYISIHFGKKSIFISANRQYVMEHEDLYKELKKYEVSFDTFAINCERLDELRFTFCITTSIKVSRELNRVSPNNISEQSTRYVNFNKKGDVSICIGTYKPISADHDPMMQNLMASADSYSDFVDAGFPIEDARRVLPLDTATKVVYTYTLKEWEHILDLRYFETTGKASPDAKDIASRIYEALKPLYKIHQNSKTNSKTEKK